jgi:small subunit ribosomal protein S1
VDLSSLTSMLNARWKGGATAAGSQPAPLSVGQIRKFRIVKLDHEAEAIEVALI